MRFIPKITLILIILLLTQISACSSGVVKRGEGSPLLMVDESLANVKTVALVNVFANQDPIDINTKKTRKIGNSFDTISGVFTGTTKAENKNDELVVAHELSKYTFNKIQNEFSENFSWEFLPLNEVMTSQLLNQESSVKSREVARLKEELYKINGQYLAHEIKVKKLAEAQRALENAKKSVRVPNPVSFPGEKPFLIINHDDKVAARIHLADIAKELKVDAVMAVFVYVLENETHSVIGLSGKESGVGINMMMVNQNGDAIILPNEFTEKGGKLWYADKTSSQLGFLDSSNERKNEALSLYISAINKALKEHKTFLQEKLALFSTTRPVSP